METTHPAYPLVREWKRTLRAENKAHRTIGDYEDSVTLFQAWLDALPTRPDWPDVTAEHVKDFIGEQLDKHEPATALTRYEHLPQWFKYLLDEEEIDTHPMDGMKPRRVPENPVPLIPVDLVRLVLDDCKGREFEQLRGAAILRLLFDPAVGSPRSRTSRWTTSTSTPMSSTS